jgi:hypothetical protein
MVLTCRKSEAGKLRQPLAEAVVEIVHLVSGTIK